MYDKLVFIGRFQPLHNAHLAIINYALTIASEVVIVIGSANKPRDVKNPFTAQERADMIAASINGDDRGRLRFVFNHDTIYSDTAWAIRVQSLVASVSKPDDKIGLIGHKKEGDASTFYLDMFPQWTFVGRGSTPPYVNATQIREHYFNHSTNLGWFYGVVPDPVMQFLKDFRETEAFKGLVAEKDYIDKYKKGFSALPYPPTFVTVDAVVQQSGHVLMVKRGGMPGKGLWALPGGFLDANGDDSTEAGMLRELREEKAIKLQDMILRKSIKSSKLFDHPERSLRGRTLTHAFYIELDSTKPLPKVKGSDDAVEAQWVPLSEVRSDNCFEDHYEIISYFITA